MPLRIVGSSEMRVSPSSDLRHLMLGMSRTRNDRQFTPQVSQTNFGYVNAINNDPSSGGFDETEERQSQSTLSRTGTT